MAEATHSTPGHGEHGAGRYVLVWAALVVLTVATYSAWRTHLPEPWHLLAAMAIACTKAALVALFFMHLWEQGGPNRLVFATSLLFVALLIGLVVADNATRFPLANPPGSGSSPLDVGAPFPPPETPAVRP